MGRPLWKKDHRSCTNAPEQSPAERDSGLWSADELGGWAPAVVIILGRVPEFSNLTPASPSSTYCSQRLPGPGHAQVPGSNDYRHATCR